MGLLAHGTPLDWPEARKHTEKVRQRGAQQFVNLWKKLAPRVGAQLLWGDEIEYLILSIDDTTRRAALSLTQLEILEGLQMNRPITLPASIDLAPTFHQEYGRYMLESTPGAPYGPSLEDCLRVEPNMRYRRQLIQAQLPPRQLPVTLTSFPRLGAPDFTEHQLAACGPVSQSLYLPDEIINQHVRFPTLTSNIRQRRGAKVAIFVPIFKDVHTRRPFRDPTIPDVAPQVRPSMPISISSGPSGRIHYTGADVRIEVPTVPDDHIYLDAMGFGMGCCCLQITFQACSVSEARVVYDALVPVAPIMMALSAAAPIYKGFLSDVDCRWNVIAGAVDDRTKAERGVGDSHFKKIPKSRYDSVSLYIADSPLHRPDYDDVPVPIDETVEAQLIAEGIDKVLARHIAHLFIRDPLVIFAETLEVVDDDSTAHFENLQSTNWQSVRFKPPPSSSSLIGWRVEFRSMEVQITDFENAAYSIFIVLLTRAILSFDLNFYLPISKVDDNMQRAQERGACHSRKFYFRNQVLQHPSSITSLHQENIASDMSRDNSPEFDEMTMDEIMHGRESSGFPGLMGLVKAYLNSLDVDLDVKQRIGKYLNLISGRASGKLMTPATYIREFVDKHPGYCHDSIVTNEVNYDLIRRLDEIEKGAFPAEALLGPNYFLSSP